MNTSTSSNAHIIHIAQMVLLCPRRNKYRIEKASMFLLFTINKKSENGKIEKESAFI